MRRLRSAAPPRRMTGQARAEERAAYAFLTPWLIGVVAFHADPARVRGVDQPDRRAAASPGCVRRTRELRHDPRRRRSYFRKAMQVTLTWVLLTVPLFMITGLGMALLLNQKLRGMRVFRTLLYIPAVLSGVAVAVLWFVLLNGEFGAVNQLLRAIGIENPPYWFEDPELGDAGPGHRRPVGDRRQRRDLPGRAPEHPAAPVRGGIDRRRRGGARSSARSRCRCSRRRCSSCSSTRSSMPARVPGRGVRHLRRHLPAAPTTRSSSPCTTSTARCSSRGSWAMARRSPGCCTISGCIVVFAAFRLEKRFVYYEAQ